MSEWSNWKKGEFVWVTTVRAIERRRMGILIRPNGLNAWDVILFEPRSVATFPESKLELVPPLELLARADEIPPEYLYRGWRKKAES